MSGEHTVHEIVTKFLLDTCRLRPLLSRHAVQAAGWCALLATDHPRDDTEADFIPLTTGSVAEFYICLLYTSPSPRDGLLSRMPSSA